ncbi:MAG: hypothetical protein ABFD64_04325 [Armatimonadota bacterium]
MSGSQSGGSGGKGGTGGIGGPGNGKYKDAKGPVPTGKDGYTTKSSTMVGKEGMIYSGGTTKGAPDKAKASSVPYYEVLPNYKKSAEKALVKEKVPPAYRKPVSKYFESLTR